MLDIIFQKKNGSYTTNFILAADSYKVGQGDQYPKGTKKIHSNMVPRKPWLNTSPSGDILETIEEVVVMGPQVCAAIIANVVITDEMIDEAELEINEQGYDFPRARWEYIRDLGYLPISIKALEEGSIAKIGLPIMTIENTDEESAWLVSYMETWMQDIVWVMTTIASKVRVLRRKCEEFAAKTGVDIDGPEVEFMIHNFGDRGAGGQDRAVMAAMAHGLFFSGTDCLRANRYIKKFYNTTQPYLSSIDASEHSTMCSNSDLSEKNDYGAFEMGMQMLERSRWRSERGVGIPVVANVIDTYDDERFIKEFVVKEYDRICNTGAKYVCRPDSGNAILKPIEVCRWLIEGLAASGHKDAIRMTSNGSMQLPENLGVIQGDGLKFEDFEKIFDMAYKYGLAASNFATGFGGGMTNGSGRDDFSFSMKATARMDADGRWIDMQKSPKSDLSKSSLCGRITVFARNDGYLIAERTHLIDINSTLVDVMKEIYNNGKVELLTFEQVRANARGQILTEGSEAAA
jgi:nicotinamide phosphoribosyltransferase